MEHLGPLTLLPALVAIVLALVTRQVLVALFGGVWLGAALLCGNVLQAFPRSLDIVAAIVADADKAKTLLFTVIMGGMVGLIARSGGTAGLVQLVTPWAKTRRSGSLATSALGVLVFFDDYASSLIVGNTMRPITDGLRISREKLSFIVDATAAPVASLAIVSTWIGYEITVMQQAFAASGIERDGCEIFLLGLGSRFYPLLMLVFLVLLAATGRDFASMLRAERRAFHEGLLLRPGATPLMDDSLVDEEAMKAAMPVDAGGAPAARGARGARDAWRAIVPIVTMTGTVLAVLAYTGLAGANAPDVEAAYAKARADGVLRAIGFVLGKASTYDALVYGASAGAAVALFAAFTAKLRSGVRVAMTQSLDGFIAGARAVVLALMVLVLAWSIGKVMSDLKAGAYVASLIGTSMPAWSLPTLTFLIASALSFATGTSWGTMAILFPIAIPVVAPQMATLDPAAAEHLLLGVTSAVLAGAVFGDHCSPISDTTVLASIASACDHVDHSTTQLPYAVVVGVVAIVFGTLPFALGVPAWLCLIVASGALYAFLRFVGRRVDDP